MPQDIRIAPDGKLFFVADMVADGVHVIDGDSFKQVGFIHTGIGAHGLYPSRNAKFLYVANRGSNVIRGKSGGKGSISVIEFATRTVIKNWPITGGGSPDMGNVSADGKYLWLSGRYDDVVYRIDTESGYADKIKVGREPHGLTVWPQPGRSPWDTRAISADRVRLEIRFDRTEPIGTHRFRTFPAAALLRRQ